MLYIPGMAPLNNEDVVNPKTKNIRLYVKRVFISDDFDGELVRNPCISLRLANFMIQFAVPINFLLCSMIWYIFACTR